MHLRNQTFVMAFPVGYIGGTLVHWKRNPYVVSARNQKDGDLCIFSPRGTPIIDLTGCAAEQGTRYTFPIKIIGQGIMNCIKTLVESIGIKELFSTGYLEAEDRHFLL